MTPWFHKVSDVCQRPLVSRGIGRRCLKAEAGENDIERLPMFVRENSGIQDVARNYFPDGRSGSAEDVFAIFQPVAAAIAQ